MYQKNAINIHFITIFTTLNYICIDDIIFYSIKINFKFTEYNSN